MSRHRASASLGIVLLAFSCGNSQDEGSPSVRPMDCPGYESGAALAPASCLDIVAVAGAMDSSECLDSASFRQLLEQSAADVGFEAVLFSCSRTIRGEVTWRAPGAASCRAEPVIEGRCMTYVVTCPDSASSEASTEAGMDFELELDPAYDGFFLVSQMGEAGYGAMTGFILDEDRPCVFDPTCDGVRLYECDGGRVVQRELVVDD